MPPPPAKVSPGAGNLGTVTTRSALTLPTTHMGFVDMEEETTRDLAATERLARHLGEKKAAAGCDASRHDCMRVCGQHSLSQQ